MEQVAVSTKLCPYCTQVIPADALICTYCGSTQFQEEDAHEMQRDKWLKILFLFYGSDMVICALVNFLDYFRGLGWLFITQIVLAVLTLIFSSLLWKDIKPLFRWKTFTIPKALVYAVTAVLFAIIVNIAVKWANQIIFHKDVYYYRSFRHLPYPKLAMITVVAVFPAIFEELAYRGIILESLFRVTEERQAIFIAAFLFAVIHMSFISFFWLLPFAVWLGNIRTKEKTIWYGVLVHFCFNITACLYEFYELKLFEV